MGFFTKKGRDESYDRMAERDLLDRIRDGDQAAMNYVFTTHHAAVLTHMQIVVNQQNKPEYSGQPDDFAQGAFEWLLDKANQKGGALLKEYSDIRGWLKSTGTNLMRNALRKERHIDRIERNDPDADVPFPSMARHADEDADRFTDMTEKDQDTIIHQVMSRLPEELHTLIRVKFMEGRTWKEASELMLRLYPDHKPPFELSYLQKTYWDRVHKKPFIDRLGNDLDV